MIQENLVAFGAFRKERELFVGFACQIQTVPGNYFAVIFICQHIWAVIAIDKIVDRITDDDRSVELHDNNEQNKNRGRGHDKFVRLKIR